MTKPKMLCLNMIVRNEMANLERCLGAVADHIDCWVIGDTGSTDGTQDFIKSFFAKHNLPGELHSFPFHNFEQARNAALERANASPLGYDYLLFADADMEVVVEDHGFRERLEAPGYRLLQRSDALAYWNTRLVQRNVGARYRGVTHEYLDVPGDVKELHGVWYKDHASGSNRVDKFERDIRLLLDALKQEPENHRYWFYLAQSYRDAGQTEKAAEAYAKRAEMGGWDEEAWNARLQQARCLRALGNDAGFVSTALAAFNQRPQRAEPLYDLARFYREKGMNDVSVMFSEAGLAIKRPEQDILFLEDFVYSAGLQEEFSIAANYARDPARKDRGFATCNWLALNRTVPDGSRELAWSNLFYYLQPASALMPSFAARPVGFAAPDGYRSLNPSVTRLGDEIFLAQRTVNYALTEDGLQYQTPNKAPIHTRNFLLRLSGELQIEEATEILPPADLPEPAYKLVMGFEDLRLFAWRGELWGCACIRELTPEGWCEQVLARIGNRSPEACRLTDWRVLRPKGPRVHEKNWMPRVSGETLQFIYLCDPTRLLDENAQTIIETAPALAANRFRGGSQAIAFNGGWLSLIHEVQWRPSDNRRFYHHRFVWFDEMSELRGVSRPFFFQKKGVEFAAGLAWHPDGKHLLISYSVADSEAWIATVVATDVQAMLENAEYLPSAATEKQLREPLPGNAFSDRQFHDQELGTAGADNQPSFANTQNDPLVVGKQSRLGTQNEQDGEATASYGRNAITNAGSPRKPVAATPNKQPEPKVGVTSRNVRSTRETFLNLAPFLCSSYSPQERLRLSREFDARIAPFLSSGNGAALPQIHCFYEVLSDNARHNSLVAATASMRAAGHPVRVWSYSPQKLDFLLPQGIEVSAAEDIIPRGLFEQIVAGSEIRYFSDIFRYAVLYERGGLWMDSDLILLRPFPFRGDHFFNLQWRSGVKEEHFVCGNVMYAEPHSPHLRNLYEMSLDLYFASRGWVFGEVGPKLLSDYIASDAATELRDRLFSPVFFNAIDWTEVDSFRKPTSELADYLNDERVFGIHLWTARNEPCADGKDASLISLLFDPLSGLPSLTRLADQFNTDKNRHTGNRHFYARVYDRLLSARRFSLRRLMEIGLCRGLAERNQTEAPSVKLWQTYFPFGHIVGVDLTDFSQLNNERFTSFVCDQSERDELRAVAAHLGLGSCDVIIDDGSHASFDQQLTLREFFPLLADGGWYFIEDLDWQPQDEDANQMTLTKELLRDIKQHGKAQSADPLGVSELSDQIAEILFFDSHYELERANLMGGLAAIRKRGGSSLVR
ncbi:glycosyltransferase [Bradyrhizobium septentrionale]|uniref:glycosyltransferase n=1 Tax=Bradyrhizobium septentrionale TaxID=1404411 RepID=UPI0015968B73|nr:glycosyltransferase [Bradyrhizobium septentrionale]UGY22001.1 glycosyltransferase [Bradyrhizobium septentrionale]